MDRTGKTFFETFVYRSVQEQNVNSIICMFKLSAHELIVNKLSLTAKLAKCKLH